MSNSNAIESRDLTALGFPGYRATTAGDVFTSLERAYRMKPSGLFYVATDVWRKLTPVLRGQGYLCVSLRRVPTYVHRLILLAFVGPCPTGMHACHGDGSRINNALSNLRWDTPLNNHRDAVKHGRMHYGSQHPMAKLDEAAAAAIRAEYASGSVSQASIAASRGVSQTLISQIVRGLIWH